MEGVITMEKVTNYSKWLASKINWKLVPIKVVYFFYMFGMQLIAKQQNIFHLTCEIYLNIY